MTFDLVVEFIIVLLDLIDGQIAIALQIYLDADIVFVGECLELHGDGQLFVVKILIADALDDVAHVEVELAHHVEQQPGRLHGVEFVIDVG